MTRRENRDEYDRLCRLIQRWNDKRVELFEISLPNEVRKILVNHFVGENVKPSIYIKKLYRYIYIIFYIIMWVYIIYLYIYIPIRRNIKVNHRDIYKI